jgi:hypothetical protein
MTGMAHNGWRAVFALLLLCAVAFWQSAALTSTHELHRTQGHSCQVCYLGSLPFLESTGEASVAPIWPVARLICPPQFEAAHDARPAARSSRAPPA